MIKDGESTMIQYLNKQFKRIKVFNSVNKAFSIL